MRLIKLSEVAPSKALSINSFSEEQNVWLLNLDQIQSNTGEAVEVKSVPVTDIKGSVHGFDQRHVLYSKLRPYLNKVVVPCKPGVATTELVPMLPDPEVLDRNYLAYYLKSKKFVNWVKSQIDGAKMPRVSMKIFWDHKIPLPPLEEQKRIAVILDKAEAIRRKREEAIKLADEFLRSVFLDMFGDPVTNPKGWAVLNFGDVGTSRLGKMLDKGREVGDCQYPYLANFNVQWGRFNLDNLRCMDFSEEDRKEFELREGDLLICEGGEVGRTAIWRNELNSVFFQKALHRVRLDLSITNPEYVQSYMLFMAKNGGFGDFTNSATIAHLTGVKLKMLPIPIPPLNIQKIFSKIFKSIERQKILLNNQLVSQNMLFGSLQQRAFKGEL